MPLQSLQSAMSYEDASAELLALQDRLGQARKLAQDEETRGECLRSLGENLALAMQEAEKQTNEARDKAAAEEQRAQVMTTAAEAHLEAARCSRMQMPLVEERLHLNRKKYESMLAQMVKDRERIKAALQSGRAKVTSMPGGPQINEILALKQELMSLSEEVARLEKTLEERKAVRKAKARQQEEKRRREEARLASAISQLQFSKETLAREVTCHEEVQRSRAARMARAIKRPSEVAPLPEPAQAQVPLLAAPVADQESVPEPEPESKRPMLMEESLLERHQKGLSLPEEIPPTRSQAAGNHFTDSDMICIETFATPPSQAFPPVPKTHPALAIPRMAPTTPSKSLGLSLPPLRRQNAANVTLSSMSKFLPRSPGSKELLAKSSDLLHMARPHDTYEAAHQKPETASIEKRQKEHLVAYPNQSMSPLSSVTAAEAVSPIVKPSRPLPMPRAIDLSKAKSPSPIQENPFTSVATPLKNPTLTANNESPFDPSVTKAQDHSAQIPQDMPLSPAMTSRKPTTNQESLLAPFITVPDALSAQINQERPFSPGIAAAKALSVSSKAGREILPAPAIPEAMTPSPIKIIQQKPADFDFGQSDNDKDDSMVFNSQANTEGCFIQAAEDDVGEAQFQVATQNHTTQMLMEIPNPATHTYDGPSSQPFSGAPVPLTPTSTNAGEVASLSRASSDVMPPLSKAGFNIDDGGAAFKTAFTQDGGALDVRGGESDFNELFGGEGDDAGAGGDRLGDFNLQSTSGDFTSNGKFF